MVVQVLHPPFNVDTSIVGDSVNQLHTHIHTLFSAHARTHSDVVNFTRVHVTRDICLQVEVVSHHRLRGSTDCRSDRQLAESVDL